VAVAAVVALLLLLLLLLREVAVVQAAMPAEASVHQKCASF
jgi:hypothetical protein